MTLTGPGHGADDAGQQHATDAAPGPERVRMTAWVHGGVQGVGFRWWTRSRALELGLTGWARNLDDGRVEVVAEGDRAAADELEALLRGGGTPGRVEAVTVRHSPPRGGLSNFRER